MTSDFNTNGAVVIRLTAAAAGPGGNNISLVVTKRNNGAGVLPIISVSGTTISAELNTYTSGPSTAQALVNAINSSADASTLVHAEVLSGSGSVNIAAPDTSYSPLNLGGANIASATTNFGTGGSLQVKFTAAAAGMSSNGISIVFTGIDRGGAAAPRITVNGRTITVELNTHAGNQSTAQDLLDALNNHAAASALATASIPIGNAATAIAPSGVGTRLTLSGANDVVVAPGYIGLGDSPREVIFRFREALVDDLYRIDIIGSGPSPLSTVDGDSFNEGRDDSLLFDLNLGPQVLAVVPQPIVRLAGSGVLQQQRDKIHVYFNQDDLRDDAASAENPNFYQLIFTKDSVENTDDVVFKPTSVSYNAASDMAVLTFARPLNELINPATGQAVGAGTWRCASARTRRRRPRR